MRQQQTKADRYDELMEQYVNDEITEAEMEAEMDELLESGDDFLDERDDFDGSDITNEVAFRIREIGQIVGLLAYLGIAGYIVVMMPPALPVVAVVTLIAAIAYARWSERL